VESVPNDIRFARGPNAGVVIREQALGDFRQDIDACCARKGDIMKGILLAGAALLTIAASPAHAVTYSWQGDLFVTAVNDANACGAVGLRVGDFARGVFRPKGLGTNGANDMLAWYFGRSAGHLQASGSLHGATAATVHIIYGSGGLKKVVGAVLSGATVSPNPVALNTQAVRITFTMVDAYPPQTGVSNCDATFQGTLAKRPGQ
jgi:hypothetical protein